LATEVAAVALLTTVFDPSNSQVCTPESVAIAAMPLGAPVSDAAQTANAQMVASFRRAGRVTDDTSQVGVRRSRSAAGSAALVRKL
jgi:hypothetical protein